MPHDARSGLTHDDHQAIKSLSIHATHTHAYARIRMHVYASARMCMHVRTHIHMYARTHAHMQAWPDAWLRAGTLCMHACTKMVGADSEVGVPRLCRCLKSEPPRQRPSRTSAKASPTPPPPPARPIATAVLFRHEVGWWQAVVCSGWLGASL